MDNQEQIWEWEQYLEKLRRAHVRLKETTNELSLAWNKEGGEFNVKLGYMAFQYPLANEGSSCSSSIQEGMLKIPIHETHKREWYI